MLRVSEAAGPDGVKHARVSSTSIIQLLVPVLFYNMNGFPRSSLKLDCKGFGLGENHVKQRHKRSFARHIKSLNVTQTISQILAILCTV